MKTVFKYAITGHRSVVSLPDGAVVLSVNAQGDDMFLWALVDAELPARTERVFRVYATGQPIAYDTNLQYIGTVFMYRATMVFHVFEDMSVL